MGQCVWRHVIGSKPWNVWLSVCKVTKVCWCATLCRHVIACVRMCNMCCHTPTRLFLFRDYCSGCMSWGTFWLDEEGVIWMPDSLIISGEEQGNQPWDWKHKFNFPNLLFLCSLLLTLSQPTERQLAQPNQSATWRWRNGRMVQEERDQKGEYKIFSHQFFHRVFIPSCGKKKERERQKRVEWERES